MFPGLDKLEHVLASAFVAGDAYWLSVESGASPRKRVIMSGVAALTAGAAKELIWDYALGRGDPSWRDFAADVVGMLFGVGCSIWIDRAIVHQADPAAKRDFSGEPR